MSKIEEILRLNVRPNKKQAKLIEAVSKMKIPAKEFIAFFESASDMDKGTCADTMKHVSAKDPEIFAPYVDILVKYINYKAPRVKWGVPETIGHLAQKYPEQVAKAIPDLLKNTAENKINTTVIRWCAAYALAEIAKYNPQARAKLLPIFMGMIKNEKNNGVKNVYLKALAAFEKGVING